MRVTKHAPAKSSLVVKSRYASTDASGDEEGNHTLKPLLILLYLMCGALMAQQTKVTTLMSKDLTELSGKEGVMLEVDYPPGASDPIHRHNAYAFVYVLEGTVVMQVKGGEPVTLTSGQTFYEGPNDVHIVGRNASNTKPDKFLAFLIKSTGAPILTPVK